MPRGSRSARDKSYAHIDGLSDFLKDMGVLPAQMARAERIFQTLAATTVLTLAQANARDFGRQQNRAAEDLKVAGPGTVVYGGKAWSFGAEFGSYQFKQFPEWRGNKEDAGYFFWPAIGEFRDEDMINQWVQEVWSVVEGLFSN